MDFGCTGCGACCKRIGTVIKEAQAVGFPYGVNEKGWCEKLGENGLCTVYENRPDMCKIEKAFEQQIGKTKKEVYLENAKACNTYIREDKLDEKFLVNEKQYQ